MVNIKPNCFGVIVLDLVGKKTILVETSNGYLSFPKGKYEKKKDLTNLDCALRELEEETGIKSKNVNIIADKIINEFTTKGNCNIQYYIGIIDINFTEFIFNFDPEEISSVKWYEFDEINSLKNLKKERKDVFNNLLSLLNLSEKKS